MTSGQHEAWRIGRLWARANMVPTRSSNIISMTVSTSAYRYHPSFWPCDLVCAPSKETDARRLRQERNLLASIECALLDLLPLIARFRQTHSHSGDKGQSFWQCARRGGVHRRPTLNLRLAGRSGAADCKQFPHRQRRCSERMVSCGVAHGGAF